MRAWLVSEPEGALASARAAIARLLMLTLCLCVASTAGCPDTRDCELYDTCADGLIKQAAKMARKAGGAKRAQLCELCLQGKCQSEAAKCSVDLACNYTTRCQLETTPDGYQTCLRMLQAHGYSDGAETQNPWEGGSQDAEKDFGSCLLKECKPECYGDPWDCSYSQEAYDNIAIELAVRSVWEHDFTAVTNVRARACGGSGDGCGDWRPADPAGHITLPKLSSPSPESLYFELEPLDAAAATFPRTLYYPQLLGRRGLQLVPVYVIPTDLIKVGNASLDREREVLTSASQSLILPHSCIWEYTATPHLTVHVQGVPQCYEHEATCVEGVCPPCVWYTDSLVPTRYRTETDTTGAGIVGLTTNKYTVEVKNADGATVSRRTIRMQDGAMTIARTWPLPREQQSASSE